MWYNSVYGLALQLYISTPADLTRLVLLSSHEQDTNLSYSVTDASCTLVLECISFAQAIHSITRGPQQLLPSGFQFRLLRHPG